MDNKEIYGKYREYLSRVMEDITGKIRDYNEETIRTSGHPIYEHLIYRIKSEESMAEKCIRKGVEVSPYSALYLLHDAIGIRIVTGFVDDIYANINMIKNIPGCAVIDEKDYIKNSKPNGYRSYHMILEITEPFEDVTGKEPGHYFAEVQLRTIAMDSWASLEHEMKYKREISNQKMLVAELKRCADELASCDISMQTIRDIIRNG